MVLLTCEGCGHQVSSQAAACPGCGAPVEAAGPELNPPVSGGPQRLWPARGSRSDGRGLRAQLEAFFADWNTIQRLSLVFVVGVVLFVIIPRLSKLGPSDREVSQMAEILCREYVRHSLRSPSSAYFVGSPKIQAEASGYFAITGQIDADDAFGAKLRDTYTCRIQYKGLGSDPDLASSWRFRGVKFSGD